MIKHIFTMSIKKVSILLFALMVIGGVASFVYAESAPNSVSDLECNRWEDGRNASSSPWGANDRGIVKLCTFVYTEGGRTYVVQTGSKKEDLQFNKILAQIQAQPTASKITGTWIPSCGNSKNFQATLNGVTTSNTSGTNSTSGSGGGSMNGSSSTASTTNSNNNPPCTPGVDCPEDDLGPIITSVKFNPSFSNKNRQCPIFWTTGLVKSTTDADKISCSVTSSVGESTSLPSTSPAAGYLLLVGKYEFSCIRAGTEVENRNLECRQNPSVREI